MNKVLIIICFIVSLMLVDIYCPNFSCITQTCTAAAPTKGKHYLLTGKTVQVNCEGGSPKKTYNIYLHEGKEYINFRNNWVCIQGKGRFNFSGVWYVITR